MSTQIIEWRRARCSASVAHRGRALSSVVFYTLSATVTSVGDDGDDVSRDDDEV
jgi:hypothetical protein